MELPETKESDNIDGNGLGFLDEPTEVKPEPEQLANAEPSQVQPQQPPKPSMPLDEAEKKIRMYNAKMYTRLLSEGNLWVTEPLARLKMKRALQKVKEIDFDIMIDALDRHDTKILTEAELKKAGLVFDKWTKKSEKLPFTEAEEEELQDAFAEYMAITGKLALDPGAVLAMTIIGIESKRISTLLL
jgi:hypothetical protein